jgi:hypothetical protein
MNAGTVRMAVQQDLDVVVGNRLFHGVCVDVHDLVGKRRVPRLALCSRVRGDGEALFERFRQDHRLPLRIACHYAHFLVLDVIRAQGVAMTEQYRLAV